MDPTTLATDAKPSTRAAAQKAGKPERRLLITGGAGFLGVNAAVHFIKEGWHTTLLDNLSRPGTERNLRWLLTRHPTRTTFVKEDVRNASGLAQHVRDQDAILHLAGQVAVTTSLMDPGTDFDVNARGTLNVLEAVRQNNPEAPLVFSSTNKVYGKLDHNNAACKETQPLDFHSPYGCSKGAADQYVRDYARCFHMNTVVLRQSCIYGAHQYGTEDQGWVAHFVHSILNRRPLTGARPAGRERPVRDLRGGRRQHRPDARRGLQRRRRAGEPAQPAGGHRPDRRADQPQTGVRLRGLARGRSEVLRERHRQGEKRAGLGTPRRLRPRTARPDRLGGVDQLAAARAACAHSCALGAGTLTA